MAEKKRATKSRRKEKKNVPSGHVHIQASFNNTTITVTDAAGEVLSLQEDVVYDAAHCRLGFTMAFDATLLEALQVMTRTPGRPGAAVVVDDMDRENPKHGDEPTSSPTRSSRRSRDNNPLEAKTVRWNIIVAFGRLGDFGGGE